MMLLGYKFHMLYEIKNRLLPEHSHFGVEVQRAELPQMLVSRLQMDWPFILVHQDHNIA